MVLIVFSIVAKALDCKSTADLKRACPVTLSEEIVQKVYTSLPFNLLIYMYPDHKLISKFKPAKGVKGKSTEAFKNQTILGDALGSRNILGNKW